MFTLKTCYGEYKGCYFDVKQYATNGNVALTIWNNEEGPIATVTVNLMQVKENEAFLDTNNCPWAEEFMQKNGFGKPTGAIARSGYCTYPLYELNLDAIRNA